MREFAAVIFDLGGVVCDYFPAPRLAALAADSGLTEAEIDDRIFVSELTRDFDAGRYTTRKWYETVRELLGLRMNFARFCDVWLSAIAPNTDMLAIVDTVRERVPTALLTDNPTMVLEAMPTRYAEVARRFDPLFFSCETGALKPTAEAFHGALARLGTPAERVLFIDDGPNNVAAARALGMSALRFTSPPTLRVELSVLGLIAPPRE
jgi:HAD superfamily hydrolase (TIGR01509 family)